MGNPLIDVSISLDTDKDLRLIYKMDTKIVPYLTIYDERYLVDKKKSYALKNEYGATLNPFIEIRKDGEFAKAIWKEATEDPIQELVNYLNDEANANCN